jgi:hypothetical protein
MLNIYSVLIGFVSDSLCIKINMALFHDIFKIVCTGLRCEKKDA